MKLETKVGIFFIVTMCIFSLLIMRTEKISFTNNHSQKQFYTSFNEVSGLNLKSAVRVAGIKVGEVTNIELYDNRARITLSIFKNIDVYNNAITSLNSIGILGEKYIDLNPGNAINGSLPINTNIKSSNSISIDTIIKNVGEISNDIKQITYAINGSIGGQQGQKKLDQIIGNIHKLTSEIHILLAENHSNINSTIDNLQTVSVNLKTEIPKITKQVNELSQNLNDTVIQNKPILNNMLTNINKLTMDLQHVSNNALSITNKINDGSGTIGKLINDGKTADGINSAVDKLNSMLTALDNTNFILDLSTAQWTKRKDTISNLTIDIIPTHNYWYKIGIGSTPDGQVKITKTNTDFNNMINKYQKTTITTNNSFTISAQFAKRLTEHFIITAGIIDNKGGVSFEYRTLEDRLRLNLMGYDFNKRYDKTKPRYRITSSYQLYKGCYLQCGIQDLANHKLKSFSIGGGLRWKDENIKNILALTTIKK